MLKKRKVVNGVCATEYRCEYGCGENATETEISETPYGTYICGDIDCWNSYCMDWVWQGDYVEVEEYEVEVCEECEEEWEDCMCEWEDEEEEK